MQFTKALLAAAAFAVAQAATFGMTASQFNGVTTGSAFNISWYGASGPVTLLLKNGEANALKTVATIASGLTGTSYGWIVPATLPVDYYAFEIDDSGAPNYSVRFLITGGPSLSSSGSSSVASSTSSGASTTSGSTTTSSASTSAATTGASNATTTGSTSKTSSSSASKTSSTSSSSATVPATNSAASIASPLAFILLAVAALMTLN